MKKLLALILAFCITSSLTACNDQEPGPSDSLPSDTPSAIVINNNSSDNSDSNNSSSDNSDSNNSSSNNSDSNNSCSDNSNSNNSSISSSSEESTYSEPEVTSSVTESNAPPVVYPEVVTWQKTGAVYCVEDKRLIASENFHSYISTASTLKLLTASVALHYVSSDKVFTVGSELALVPYNSSLCYIQPGQRLTLHDLLIGLLLPSGNDAAYTIAVNVARELGGEMSNVEAVEYFTGLMNQFGYELGMRNSYFVNPDGSDDTRQYSTPADMLLVAEYALTVPEIREIIAMPSKSVVFASGHTATWSNSNQLLNKNSRFYCPEAIGMKTGSTDSAGLNLISAFEKDGKTYIVIVTGCETTAERYTKTAEYYAKVGGKIGDLEFETEETSEVDPSKITFS